MNRLTGRQESCPVRLAQLVARLHNIIASAALLDLVGMGDRECRFREIDQLNNINLCFPWPVGFYSISGPGAPQGLRRSGKAVWGVIIQFPFYAGIFGLFKITALGAALTQVFVAISTPQTFLLINLWVLRHRKLSGSSGGSKWAITAPFIIPAAKQLGVSIPKTVLAYAWGDMMTDMIQPFLGNRHVGRG